VTGQNLTALSGKEAFMNVILICLLLVALLLILAFGVYYSFVIIIKLFTGCSNEEAICKIRRFFNGSATRKMEDDMGLVNDLEETVRNVIGDERYEKLVALNNSSINEPLINYGFASGLPSINVGVYYEDENEKKVLQNLMENVVSKYLEIYGYDTRILPVWKERYDLKMPVLTLRYATNADEVHALEIGLRLEQQIISRANQPVIDDSEGDLNG